MQLRIRSLLLITLLLLVTNLLAVACGASGSVNVPDDPHMLYFYAKW